MGNGGAVEARCRGCERGLKFWWLLAWWWEKNLRHKLAHHRPILLRSGVERVFGLISQQEHHFSKSEGMSLS
jgi:hypothetical protein